MELLFTDPFIILAPTQSKICRLNITPGGLLSMNSKLCAGVAGKEQRGVGILPSLSWLWPEEDAMNSPLQSYLFFPKTLALTAGRPCLLELPALSSGIGRSRTSVPLRPVHTMRDRSKNRRPLQKGRNLSIEAIQTVHSLKLSKNDEVLRGRVFETKVRRLIKSDMVAVLRELLRQDECLLALQVFDDVTKEYWYKPQVLLYAEIIAALARNGMTEDAEVIFSMMETELCEADDEGLNSVVKILMAFNMPGMAMKCFELMKKVGSEPDKSTFRALVDDMDTKGEFDVSSRLRLEAENQFGVPWEFLIAEEGENHPEYRLQKS